MVLQGCIPEVGRACNFLFNYKRTPVLLPRRWHLIFTTHWPRVSTTISDKTSSDTSKKTFIPFKTTQIHHFSPPPSPMLFCYNTLWLGRRSSVPFATLVPYNIERVDGRRYTLYLRVVSEGFCHWLSEKVGQWLCRFFIHIYTITKRYFTKVGNISTEGLSL